jgi:hypothetical protein
MSSSRPLQASSLNVTNAFSAKDAFVSDLTIGNVNVLNELTKAMDKIKELEAKIENNGGGSGKSKPAVDGKAGPPGSVGKVGPVGKNGERGLRGIKGERGATIEEFKELFDMDTATLEDGMGLIWSAKDKKWKAQTIFEN